MKMDTVQQQNKEKQQKRSAADLIGSSTIENNNNKVQCLQLNKNDVDKLSFTNKQTIPTPIYKKGISEEQFTQQILTYLSINPGFTLKDIENVVMMESVKLREGVYMNMLASKLEFSVLKSWIEEAMTNNHWNVVTMLVVLSNSVSSFLIPTLIVNLINAKQDKNIISCLRTMNDVSVSDLVQIIKYCIINNNSKSTLLNWALGYRSTYKLMINELRLQLSIEQSTQLLEYIMKQLEIYSQNEVVDAQNDDRVLSMNQLVDWTSVLLDSHFQDWTRKPDVLVPYATLIRNLQFDSKLISKSRAFINSNIISEKNIDANYSIHYFNI